MSVFTDPCPAVLNGDTLLSDIEKAYDNTFYLKDILDAGIPLASGVTGILPVANGGTGETTSTGTGAVVKANSPAFTAVPTFKPGAGLTPAVVSGCIYVDATNAASSGGGSEILRSTNLPANTLNVNGKVIRVTAFGTAALNANAKNISLMFGATAVCVLGVIANNIGWIAQAIIIRTGATAQVAIGPGISSLATSNSGSAATNSTPAETCASDVAISVECNTAAASDIIYRGMLVEVLN